MGSGDSGRLREWEVEGVGESGKWINWDVKGVGSGESGR